MIATSLLCLTLNIFHEARGESLIDQIGVAAVTMNRVRDKGYPKSVCKVVYQPNQFVWTSRFKTKKIKFKNKIEEEAYLKAKTIAALYLKGKLKNPIGQRKYFSTSHNFRTKYKPMKLTRRSKHIFY